ARRDLGLRVRGTEPADAVYGAVLLGAVRRAPDPAPARAARAGCAGSRGVSGACDLRGRSRRSDHAQDLRADFQRDRHPFRAIARAPTGQRASLPRLHPDRGPRVALVDLPARAVATVSTALAVTGILLAALSGVPGLALPREHPAGDRAGALLLG